MQTRTEIFRIFKELGGVVELEKDNGVHRYPAVLQPVRDRNKQYLEHGADLYGWEDREQFLYYGPCQGGGELLASGDLLRVGGETYLVKRCEPFYDRGVPIYRWAVLQHAVEEVEP